MPDILIVDDESKYVEPARKALKKAGFNIRIAYSIKGARKIVQKKIFDAIILDILFPSQPGVPLEPMGFDFLKKLKSTSKTRNIPVIMFTVVFDHDMEKKCKDAGAVGYIMKKAGGAQILAVLKEAGVPQPNASQSSRPGYQLFCALASSLRIRYEHNEFVYAFA